MKDFRYSHLAYDERFNLKMNLALWSIMVFLLRPYIVFIISVINPRDRMGLINMFYGDRFMLVLGAMASVFVIPVLYANRKRVPDASDRTRWIWSHGRMFLILATLANALFLFAPVVLGEAGRITLMGWGQLAICIWIVHYLLTSRRVKDTFEDFPLPAKVDSA